MESVNLALVQHSIVSITDISFLLLEADGTVDVHDHTQANVVNLRRTIYLTIMSALDFEEAVHKLLKIDIGQGQEVNCLLHLSLVSLLSY